MGRSLSDSVKKVKNTKGIREKTAFRVNQEGGKKNKRVRA